VSGSGVSAAQRKIVVATPGVGDAHRADVALEGKAVLVDAVNGFHVSARRFKVLSRRFAQSD
jgi:hypothetical protein